MPHCIGAVDGKHVRIEKPANTGSTDRNYKGYFSLNLFAICDANYNFLLFDVGGDGGTSDTAILNSSELGHKLQDPDNYFKIPAADHLDGMTEDLPCFLVGDYYIRIHRISIFSFFLN